MSSGQWPCIYAFQKLEKARKTLQELEDNFLYCPKFMLRSQIPQVWKELQFKIKITTQSRAARKLCMANLFYCRSTNLYVPLMIVGTAELFSGDSKGKLAPLLVKVMWNFQVGGLKVNLKFF